MNQQENKPTLRKRGRPSVEDKGIRVTIRLKKHEEDLLKGMCKELGHTLSEGIRLLILFNCDVIIQEKLKK
jgi:hypothetical protein